MEPKTESKDIEITIKAKLLKLPENYPPYNVQISQNPYGANALHFSTEDSLMIFDTVAVWEGLENLAKKED